MLRPRLPVRTSTALLPALLTLAWASPALAEEPAPPDLSGRWAMLQIETELSKAPMVGKVTTAARTLFLVEVAQKGTRLALREQVCAVRFQASSPTAASGVRPDFVRHLPAERRGATLAWRKGKWRLEMPRHVHVRGAKLKDKKNEPLPEKASDPRVVDTEKDGLPGMTVVVDGMVKGTIGMVQRAWTSRQGLVRSADRVDGLVRWGREQRYLTASNPLLRIPVDSGPHPDRTKHTFTMRRVDAKMTCQRLVNEASRVF